MADTRTHGRWIAALLLAAALAALGARSAEGPRARITRLRVDPGRDGAGRLEALDGMGAEPARRIVAARRDGGRIRSAADLVTVPGVGARRVHRWSEDLSFEEDRR
jgi:hypothetical protein